MKTAEKIKQLKELAKTVELIKSGYAGIDIKGQIKDRRYNQGLIACRGNELLGTPKPIKVEGEFREGSPKWLIARNRELNTDQDIVDKNLELFNLLKKNAR